METELFHETKNIKRIRRGDSGGVVAIASRVVLGHYAVVMFFESPADPLAEIPDNRALLRVCKEVRLQGGGRVRLITTFASAEHWAEHEYKAYVDLPQTLRANPLEAHHGHTNIIDGTGKLLNLPIREQTLALISHDKLKHEMIRFAAANLDVLSRFDRVLTTGTTGYSLRLFFSPAAQARPTIEDAIQNLGRTRVAETLIPTTLNLLKNLRPVPDVSALLEEWTDDEQLRDLVTANLSRQDNAVELTEDDTLIKKTSWWTQEVTLGTFTTKIMALASGPKGGDILLANEVLENRCHVVIFFQDPTTAHPHETDIRLFERTCQLQSPQVFGHRTHAICITDSISAGAWAKQLRDDPDTDKPSRLIENRLVSRLHIEDVVIADVPDGDSNTEGERLGRALASAAAPYIESLLRAIALEHRDESRVVIGVPPGYIAGLILDMMEERIRRRDRERSLSFGKRLFDNFVWVPVVSTLDPTKPEIQASATAMRFRSLFGGTVELFQMSGFTGEKLDAHDVDLQSQLASAQLIILTGADWNQSGSVFQIVQRLIADGHVPGAHEAVGAVAGVFIDQDGDECHANRRGQKRAISIGYHGIESAAKRGNVLLICGGESRNNLLRAMAKKPLFNILITTESSADYLYSLADDERV